jgi:hypothetical protein
VNKRIPKTWYVATSIPNQEKTGHYSRRSKSFVSESAAKQFAATKVAEGIEVSAGTLNPVLPRRIVGPSEVAKWLSEKTGKPAIRDPQS